MRVSPHNKAPRLRLALAATALGLVVAVGSVAGASVATAQTTGTTVKAAPAPVHSEIGDCVETALDQGTDPARCVEAPSPIVPANNELFYGSIAFVILLGLMWKLALPPVVKGMEARTERIRADLARADEAKTEAEATLAEYQERVASSKAEATRIIEDARATADALKADLHKRAEAEIAELRQRAQADIESLKTQAIADLTHEVASLAIGAAEVVVQKSLDQATQMQLIENYINSVGSRN
jgi:F-type H+-transporting ATPase subunit b